MKNRTLLIIYTLIIICYVVFGVVLFTQEEPKEIETPASAEMFENLGYKRSYRYYGYIVYVKDDTKIMVSEDTLDYQILSNDNVLSYEEFEALRVLLKEREV